MSVDRNAPCPCGSGRKLKACCLATIAAAVQQANESLASDRLLAGFPGDTTSPSA
ncbi:MAG: SEC-C domain-containing protein [Chloroflexi bacterium]|nr:SEC-C domain-containing protein [Chloroflexota bacterium]